MLELRGRAPAEIEKRFRKESSGWVRLVTSKGIYLELDGAVTQLCPGTWGLIPIGVCLDNYDGLLELRPEAGQRIVCREGRISFPQGDAVLKVEPVRQEPLCLVPAPDALRGAAGELAGRTSGLAGLAAPLLLDIPLPTVSFLTRTALERISELLEALKRNASGRIRMAAAALMGLGPGLTPSGDDVLCGLVYGLLRSSLRDSQAVKTLCAGIYRDAPDRTNAIASACLRSLAEGAPFERMNDAWAALGGLRPGDIRRLTAVGSSSGSEMLLGLLLAGKLLHGWEEDSNG